jgi:RNA polymerase sigma factor (sigma-70 family)
MKILKPTDTEIWARFRNGDNQSLSLIYNQNARKLYLYGLKFTANHSLIEDSIQDLFSDLVRTRQNLGDTNNIQIYLFKAFKRRLHRQLLKEKRYDLGENDEEYSFEIAYSIEHEIINAENADLRVKSLHRAIGTLTSRQKEAIYLRFTEGLKYEEISEIMNMSIESCRNLMYRTIKSLKDALHPKGSGATMLFIMKQLRADNNC